MEKNLVCILCPLGCRLTVTGTTEDLIVSGNMCKRGITYTQDEITNPIRTVCSTVKITGGLHTVIPVKTDKPIPEKYKLEVVKALNSIVLTSPVKMGDVIISDLFGTGVNMIAERDM